MLSFWGSEESKANVFSKLQFLVLAKGIPFHLQGQEFMNSPGEARQKACVFHSQTLDPGGQDMAGLAHLAMFTPGQGGPCPYSCSPMSSQNP